MKKKKSYAIILLPDKTIKKNYETASAAKYDYPNALKIELFNSKGQKIASINANQ